MQARITPATIAPLLLMGSAMLYGVARAGRLGWVCDDAFISFRYAWNLARGKGLVFNAGEYVEGFTNLLWTLALSPFFIVQPDVDISVVAIGLGILCYGLLLFEYFRKGRRYNRQPGDHPEAKPLWHAWPWTLPALAAHHHLHVFASSGLETALFTLLITAGVLRVREFLADACTSATRGGFVLLALACLTRPDGLLVYGIAGAFAAFTSWRAFQSLTDAPLESDKAGMRPRTLKLKQWILSQLRLHAFFALTVGSSFVFRWFYYGEILPNTFYAKSAHDPYFGQGLLYVGLYFAAYWVCVPLLVALIAGAIRKPRELAPIAAICCAWLVYVGYVGGDFMFARFLVPITPLLYFGGEGAMRSFLRRRTRSSGDEQYEMAAKTSRFRWWIPALIALAATAGRYDPYRGRALPVIGYVGEEHKIYTSEGMRHLKATALATRATMQAADPVVAFVGAQAALIFYWDITTAIEAQTGLTDRSIARMPLEERGWVGHEKSAPLAYLRERDVAFILRPPPPERRASNGVMKIEGLIGEFEIIKYRPETMEILRRDIRFEIPERAE